MAACSRKRSRSKRWIRSQRTADSQSNPSAASSKTSWVAGGRPRRPTHKRPLTCLRAAARSSIDRITTGCGSSSVKGNRNISHCLIPRQRVLNPGKSAARIPHPCHPRNTPRNSRVGAMGCPGQDAQFGRRPKLQHPPPPAPFALLREVFAVPRPMESQSYAGRLHL